MNMNVRARWRDEKQQSEWVSKRPRWSHVWHRLTQKCLRPEAQVVDAVRTTRPACRLNLCWAFSHVPGPRRRTDAFVYAIRLADKHTRCFVFDQELGLLFAGQFVLSTSHNARAAERIMARYFSARWVLPDRVNFRLSVRGWGAGQMGSSVAKIITVCLGLQIRHPRKNLAKNFTIWFFIIIKLLLVFYSFSYHYFKLYIFQLYLIQKNYFAVSKQNLN